MPLDLRGPKGRWLWLAGVALGIVFSVIGYTSVLPRLGLFGAVWTGVVVLVTLSNAYAFLLSYRHRPGGDRDQG